MKFVILFIGLVNATTVFADEQAPVGHVVFPVGDQQVAFRFRENATLFYQAVQKSNMVKQLRSALQIPGGDTIKVVRDNFQCGSNSNQIVRVARYKYSNAKEINKTIQNISDYVQKYCSPTEADMRERLGINPLLQLAHTSSMDRHNNTNPRDFKRESTCSHCTQKLQIGDEVK